MCAMVAAALPAGAICGPTDNRTFTTYAYFQGGNGNSSDILGSFWQVGGAPNNGTFEAGNGWAFDTGSGIYLLGTWAQDPGIVGCPSPAPPAVVTMAYLVSSPDASGGTIFAAGCAASDPDGNFRLHPGAGSVGGQAIPKPNVLNSVRQGSTSVDITVGPPAVPGGVIDDSGCGLGPTGYQLYARNVGRNATAPADRGRLSGTWTPVGPAQGPGSQETVNVGCVGDQDIYLAYGITFGSFETEHVGANSTVVQCGSTASDQPRDFKIIKKPIKRPAIQQ
jgi:hypothetical protein